MGLLGEKHISQNFHISTTCLWGLWEMEFFFCWEGGLKSSTCCYGCVWWRKTPCRHNSFSMDCIWVLTVMRSLVPSTLLSWSISRRGTKLLYNWWWEYGPLHCTTLPPPLLLVGLLVHITKHSHSPAITSWFCTVDCCAKSHHQYCVCNAIFDWRTWLMVFFLFFSLLYGNFWGAVSGNRPSLGGSVTFPVYLFLKCITILFTLPTHVMFSFTYHNKHSV